MFRCISPIKEVLQKLSGVIWMMMKGRYVPALIGEKPHCMQCEGIELRRQGRFGFWQRVMLPMLGLYPWECGLCRKIYLLKQRSMDYRQRPSETNMESMRLELPPLPLVASPTLHSSLQKNTSY